MHRSDRSALLLKPEPRSPSHPYIPSRKKHHVSDLLEERRGCSLGLGGMAVQSRCVHEIEDESNFRELAKEVE